MSKPDKSAIDLISVIRHELPVFGAAVTMSPCQRCKTASARGGGICLGCRTDELAQRVGRDLALAFVAAAREDRRCIGKILEEESRREDAEDARESDEDV